MAIRITEDGTVIYENSPDVNRKLFPNLNVCGKEIDKLEEEINGKAPAVFSTTSGSIASFDNGADDLPMKSAVVNIEPIQEGSGDPSPENVRPISGRTGLSVTRTGKNLLDLNRDVQDPLPKEIYVSPRIMSTRGAYIGLRADNYYYRNYITGYSNIDGGIKLTTLNNIKYGVKHI